MLCIFVYQICLPSSCTSVLIFCKASRLWLPHTCLFHTLYDMLSGLHCWLLVIGLVAFLFVCFLVQFPPLSLGGGWFRGYAGDMLSPFLCGLPLFPCHSSLAFGLFVIHCLQLCTFTPTGYLQGTQCFWLVGLRASPLATTPITTGWNRNPQVSCSGLHSSSQVVQHLLLLCQDVGCQLIDLILAVSVYLSPWCPFADQLQALPLACVYMGMASF